MSAVSFLHERRIPVLAVSSFAVSTQTVVFAGLLNEMAAELGQPVAVVGQLATVFALGFGLAAPLVAAATGRVPRRVLIVGALALLAVVNLGIAFAPGLGTMLVLRVVAGIVGSAVVPAAAATAVAMAPPERRGRALGLVIAGVTAAFLLGIPLGSAFGGWFGWRACFVFAAVLLAGAAVVIRVLLPDVQASDAAGIAGLRAVRRPEVVRALALTFLGFTAIFALAAYIGPAVNRVSGLTGGQVGLMQALVGVASMLGVPLGARIADRRGAAGAWPLFVGIVVSQALQMALLLAGLPFALAMVLQGAAILLGAAALFALSPIVQARLVTLAPQARGVVLAFNASMLFLGQAAGAAIGGAAIALAGLPAMAAAGVLAGLAGLALAWSLRAG